MHFSLLTSPKPALSLFFTWRPGVDEIFSLDAANSMYYRFFNIGRYVLAMFVATKIVRRAYPFLFSLQNRDRFQTSEETEGITFIYADRWQRVLKSAVTISVRVVVTELFSRFCQRALDVTVPLSSFNLPGHALRFAHRFFFSLAFKNSGGVLSQVAAIVASAPKTSISRALIFDSNFELFAYKYGYFLIQPLVMTLSTIARDTASATGIGSLLKVTTFSMSHYKINTTDVTIAFIAAAFTDLVSSLISYCLIPRITMGKNSMALDSAAVLDQFFIFGYTTLGYLATNAFVARLVGPTNSVVSIRGHLIPTSLICVGIHVLYIGILKILEDAILIYAKRGYRFIKNGGPQSPQQLEEQDAKYVEWAKFEFSKFVGKEWKDMSQSDVHAIMTFCYQVTAEGIPNNAMHQYAAVYLFSICNFLALAEPPENTLLMKAIENGDITRHNPAEIIPSSLGLQNENSMLAPEPSTIVGEDDPCAVCLKQLNRESKDIVVGKKCGHAYHTQCLRDCLNLNAKCPLCNTELLSAKAGEEKYEVPLAADEEGNGIQYLACSKWEYNDSANNLFLNWNWHFQHLLCWGQDLRLLTRYIQRHRYSENPVYLYMIEHLNAMQQPYADTAGFYSQMVPPYTQLMPALEVNEEGQPIQSFWTNTVSLLIAYCTGLAIKVPSFWGNIEQHADSE